MFGFIYAWQFPHSYGLNWTFREDFRKAGFKMIPESDPDGKKTVQGMFIANSCQLACLGGMMVSGMINPFVYIPCHWYFRPQFYDSYRLFKGF
jgi:heme O synthase-like polyprenyltransferase